MKKKNEWTETINNYNELIIGIKYAEAGEKEEKQSCNSFLQIVRLYAMLHA